MAKVAIKNENITSFGGIYHIMDVFSKLGFEKLTESVLGKRGSSGKAFSHGSIFGSLFFSYLCGGECLEDINALIGQFKQKPDTLLPSADTVGRGLKELTEKNVSLINLLINVVYSYLFFDVLVILCLNCFQSFLLVQAHLFFLIGNKDGEGSVLAGINSNILFRTQVSFSFLFPDI